MRVYLALLLALLLSCPAWADKPARTVSGVVVKVHDGDTLTLRTDNTKMRIRLYGIDAPELAEGKKAGQPHGEESRESLTSKVLHKSVKVDILDVDKYLRYVGVIRLGERDVNRDMVAEGWAWAYKKYLEAPYASEYWEVEQQARSKGLGLWAESNPRPPWEFRRARHAEY